MASNQELKWQLVGILAEKTKAAEYVNFLTEQERVVTDQLNRAMTGQSSGTVKRGPGRPAGTAAKTVTTAKAAGTVRKGRKRTISAETRRKMSEAQRARHNKGGNVNSANTGETVTATAQPAFEVPDLPQASTVQ